jgi:glycosyltransferase involved in cell wall biosynthesis
MSSTYSVVMTAYNEEEWIAEAIASVLAQTHTDFELIVIDDGSADGTVKQVRRFEDDSRLRLIQQENAGLSAARNTGIAAAKTDWVAFLDSDDLWMPEYLARVDAAVAERPDAGFAYVDAWRLDVNGLFFRASAMARQNPPADPPVDPGEFLRLLVERGNFIFVSATVRRKVFDELGGFDTDLTSCEDFDMWIRTLAAGYGGVATGERLAVKRDRPTSMSGNERKMLVNLRDVYRKAADAKAVPAPVRETAAARTAWLECQIEQIDEEGRLRTAAYNGRLRLGRALRQMRRDRVWYVQTPPEIVAAFPDWRNRA